MASFAFRVEGIEPASDPVWRLVDEAVRRAFWRAVVGYVLEAKDRELASGLDRFGEGLIPIAASTRARGRMRSHTGLGSAGNPPLTPAGMLSRTRALLTGRAMDGYAEFFWTQDAVTGLPWGQVLEWHRKGAKNLPKRDVIGLSPRSLDEVKARADQWWRNYKAGHPVFDHEGHIKLQVGHGRVGTIPLRGRLDIHHATLGAGADKGTVEAAIQAGTFTGFHQLPPKAPPPKPAPPKAPPPKPAPPKAPPPKAPPPKAEASAASKAKAVAAAKAAAEAKAIAAAKVAAEAKAAAVAKAAAEAKAAAVAKAAAEAKALAQAKAAAEAKAAAAAKAAAEAKAIAAAKTKALSGGFPASPTDVVRVKALGGSTGATLVAHPPTGKQFVKKSGAGAAHLKEEAAADAAYAALGVPVAKSKVYDTPGGPVKLAEFHEGTSLGDLLRTDPAKAAKAIKELQKHAAADMLLGNWDVVGMNLDNVLVTKSGQVLRIDNGGSLRYRAQGAPKSATQFSGIVAEIQTMRDPDVNPSAAKVFGGLSDADLKKQVLGLLSRKDALLEAVPAELRATLTKRLDYLKGWAEAKAIPATPAWTPRSAAEFKGFDPTKPREMEDWGKKEYAAWAKTLKGPEKEAFKVYSEEGYTWMNGILRGDESALPHYATMKDARAFITRTTGALERARTTEAVLGYRGVRELDQMGFQSAADLMPGMQFTEAGFSSVSLDKGVGKMFTGGGSNPVLFKVQIPEGSTGAYLNAGELSSMQQEREMLFPPGAQYRVVGREATEKFAGTDVPVVVLERVK